MGLIDEISGLVKEHPVASAAGVAGIAIGAGLGTAAIIGAVKHRKSKRSKARNSRKRSGRSRDRRYISKQKHEKAYQKRRKKLGKRTYGKHYKHSRRGVHYTKKGQPYIILASGKARFIKKKRR